jgi:hypothetical protein
MTDTDRTIHGEDEIDLNDDDDDFDSSSPSGIHDIPGATTSDLSSPIDNNHYGNHIDRQNLDSTPTPTKPLTSNGASASPTDRKEESNEKTEVIKINLFLYDSSNGNKQIDGVIFYIERFYFGWNEI